MSGALVVRGEPGMGKSTLLEQAVESAPDLQVTRVVGVEAELSLGFAALHQLLFPHLPSLDRLPAPQQDALRAAFGLVDGPPPDRFLVGLAALTLLAEAAATRPLLCVIDDAQWLDRESAEVLAFVARRLCADHVALLFALREPAGSSDALAGLPALQLEGLGENAARTLLTRVVPGHLDDGVAGRIVAETLGNPLALIELAGALSASQLAGASVLPDPLPLGGRLEERFARQTALLPADHRRLVVLAAAESAGDLALLRRAAEELGLDADGLADLEDAGLRVVGNQVRFRHSLIRSAVYGAASASERREAHRALAAALDASDPDRRAWHLGAAAFGPDEDIAAELERSAERSRARGGYAAAAAQMARAADLTPASARRARRQVATAAAEVAAGLTDRAHDRLEATMPALVDARTRAEARRIQGAILFCRGHSGEAPAILLAAACELQTLDPPRARETLLEALEAAHWAGRFASGTSMANVAQVARGARAPASAAGPGELLLRGYAERLCVGYGAGVAPLRLAIAALLAQDADRDQALRWLGLASNAAGELFHEAAVESLARRWVAVARDAGALTTLEVALAVLASVEVQLGRFDTAEHHLRERGEIAAATGSHGVLGAVTPIRVLLLAWRGRKEEAAKAADEVIREAVARGQGELDTFARYGLTILYIGLGRYAAAVAAAKDVYDVDPPGLGTHVLPDLVEAAARSGDAPMAAEALERLTERAEATGTDLALGLLARSRALMTEDDDAERLYGAAIARLDRTAAAPELARAHLLFGEWLRRARRRRAAREQLTIAAERFSALGAEGFAERARRELLATGEHARRRAVETLDDLTAQEARIAELVAAGATNAQVAAQLFISPSTVAYHLRNVFRKLDVASRTEIDRALGERRDGVDDRAVAVL